MQICDVRISAPGYKTKGQMPQQNCKLDTVSGTLVNVATFKCGPRIATLKVECAWDSGGFQIKSPWRFSAIDDKLSPVQAAHHSASRFMVSRLGFSHNLTSQCK